MNPRRGTAATEPATRCGAAGERYVGTYSTSRCNGGIAPPPIQARLLQSKPKTSGRVYPPVVARLFVPSASGRDRGVPDARC